MDGIWWLLGVHSSCRAGGGGRERGKKRGEPLCEETQCAMRMSVSIVCVDRALSIRGCQGRLLSVPCLCFQFLVRTGQCVRKKCGCLCFVKLLLLLYAADLPSCLPSSLCPLCECGAVLVLLLVFVLLLFFVFYRLAIALHQQMHDRTTHWCRVLPNQNLQREQERSSQ